MNTTTYTLFVPSEDGLKQEIELLLRSLHIGGRLHGLQYLTYAISKTVRSPDATQYITKELYPEIAKHFGTTPSRVERSIRTAITYSWKHVRRETLNEVAGYHLIERPTNSEFIDFAAAYIRLQR